MSSAFIDELMRRRVIPTLFMSSPESAIPKEKDDSLDIFNILQTAIQFFDKDIITHAFERSFKTAHDMYVSGMKKKKVPRESVYDTELNRILVNWLGKMGGIVITGQWHLIEDSVDEDSYSDIVITTKDQTIILELLATATSSDLNKHFGRVLEYAKKLSTNDIWIVHFTCEDGYGIQKSQNRPHWPSYNRINTVHYYHDRTFASVLTNARYTDRSGTINKIVDLTIPLRS